MSIYVESKIINNPVGQQKKKNQEQYSTILKVMIQSKYSIRFLKILKTKIKKSDRKTNVPILVHAYNHINNIRLLEGLRNQKID